MADVFISYKQEERAAIELIATNLRALGLSVWFDASMSAGETFNDEIDREARAASAILVCWSPAARESRWVKAEAMIGFEQNKLVALYVAGPDNFSPPTPFNTSHIEDMRGWLAAASDVHASWRSVLRRIGKLCHRADMESWGALPSHSSADALRAWISAYGTSPLLMAANTLLRELDAKDAERARLEHEARERRALEEVQRQSGEEADREQEQGERRERPDREIDSARNSSNAVDQTRIRATMTGLFAALAIMIVVVGIALNASRQQAPTSGSPQQALIYEGIAIGWSRDEVLARHGHPQLVLGIPGSAGEGRQSIYAVEAWPFQLRDGESKSNYTLPQGTRVVDYFYWVYAAPQNNGRQVQVEFDPTTAAVVAVSCEIQQGFRQNCAPYGNIQIGDDEQQVITSLGQPSRASSNGAYRTLRYDELGVRFRLNSGRIYGISIYVPGRTPLGEAPGATAPTDNSVVGRWIGVLVWSDGASEPIAFNFRANGGIGNQNDVLLPSSHWVQDGSQVVARYSFFSVRGGIEDGVFCGAVRSTLGAGRTGSVALHRQARGQLIPESASCPGFQSEHTRDVAARDPDSASRETPPSVIPPNCEGLDLLYQRDSIVTEIEAAGSVFAYKGRAISGGGLYTYVAYHDLGLEVGDTFCGYQANNVMRIAGDRG